MEDVAKTAERTSDKDEKPTLPEYKELMKTTLDYILKTENEGEKCEGKTIINYTAERDYSSPEDCKKHDKIFFEILCEDGLGIGKIETKKIIRLRKKDENLSKTRPMKKVLENKMTKTKFLKWHQISRSGTQIKKHKHISRLYERRVWNHKNQGCRRQRQSRNDLCNTYKVQGPPWNLRLKSKSRSKERRGSNATRKTQEKTYLKIKQLTSYPSEDENTREDSPE